MGWVEWHGKRVALDTGKEINFRSTFVMALEKGVWRIVHVHNSNPVNNMQAFGYEARGFEDLLDAALSDRAVLSQSGIASIMFTDIADSTALAEVLGDDRWSKVAKRHLNAVEAEVTTHGGTLIKSLGDGTMSSFTSARASLNAAIALQRMMAGSDEEPRLQIRIGVHTGDLIEQDGDMIGTVVNKAARIAAMALPGEIRASEATRIMVGDGAQFHFSDFIETALKGFTGDHVIHRLEWPE